MTKNQDAKRGKGTQRRPSIAMALCLSMTCAASAAAQETRKVPGSGGTIEFVAGDPSVGPPIAGAPYSAEATTSVSQVLADGTRIERTTTTRVYRDSEGRLRREQTIQGLGALARTDETTLVTIFDPVANISYVLDPATRTARRATLRTSPFGRGSRMGEPPPPPPPPPPGAPRSVPRVPGDGANAPQSLGTRTIEGLEAIGTRRVEVIPTGKLGNDRPIEIADERWESTALKVLLQSRHSDPRTGVVEYRLTNVSRAEPAHDLFVVPSDYTIVEARN